MNRSISVSDYKESKFMYYDLELINNSYQNPEINVPEIILDPPNPPVYIQTIYGTHGINMKCELDTLPKNTPLLKDTSKFKMGIESFSFPTQSIPLFIFSNEKYYNSFTITAEFSDVSIPETITRFDYIYSTLPDDEVHYVYGYTGFLNDMNRIFSLLHSRIVSRYDTLSPDKWADNNNFPQEPPFVFFDTDSDRFVFNGAPQESGNGTYVPIKWWFSSNLCSLFVGTYFSEYKYSTANQRYGFSDVRRLGFLQLPKDFNIKSYDGIDYLEMVQECRAGGSWMKFTKLNVSTKYIKVNPASISTLLQYNTQELANTTSDINENIILTYTLSCSGPFNNNQRYEYNAQYIKWVDLLTNDDIRRLDLEFSISDTYGNIYPIYLPEGDKIYARCVFANEIF